MAFDIKQKNKRLSSDGIEEVDNETTVNLVEEASNSNVIATQSWVSGILRRFCCWTRLFHTNVLHAKSEVVTANVRTREAHTDTIYANNIILSNKNGGLVRITVGEDGKIDIEETLCDVYAYPNDCLLREYFYIDKDDIVNSFAGLTPEETLQRFIPFRNSEYSEYDGQRCYLLCVADGKDDLVDKTLLMTLPRNKIARGIATLNENGEELEYIPLAYENNIRQLTINLPRFRDIETQAIYQVQLPEANPINTQVSESPTDCPAFPISPCNVGNGDDLFNDDDDGSQDEGGLDPERDYQVIYDDYAGNTYYNITLKRDFFPNNAKVQYFMVDYVDRPVSEDANHWTDDTTNP